MSVSSVQEPAASGARRGLPAGIWAIGFVSLLMDMSSELVHSLIPVFMVTVLGASVATVGWVEGIAEATASITKIFSGALSDYLGKRKFLTVLGYGLAAFSKPLFPLASTVGLVLAARFIDRIGKGIRGAPRDALLADITPPESRGAAFGLRQALDSVGAFLGPILAIVLMFALANDVKSVLWYACVPAFFCVALLIFGVREPATVPRAGKLRLPWSAAAMKAMPARFWFVVGLGAVFTLARFSEAFLILRAQGTGLPIAWVPVVMVIMNVVYASASYPAGAAADRHGPRGLFLSGLAVLIVADLVLALGKSSSVILVGAGLWGVHMALTQGILSKLVADAAPADLRGTAFGLFNLIGGIATLAASVIAGSLWSAIGPEATFLAGAAFAAVAALGIALHRSPQPHQGPP
jgi:MFS family permease